MPEIVELIKKLRKNSKKRNFVQTFDLIINLKDFDIKKPENRIDDFVVLPSGRGKKAKIVVFSDTKSDIGCKVLATEDIETIARDKKAVKKFANETDFFLAEPKMMPIIGKFLGQVLGPRGKMPKPVAGDVKELVKKLEDSVRIVVRKNPIIQTIVGIESMKDEDIAKNVKAVIDFVEKKLPKGKQNIKSIYLKLTMSKPVRIR